jgi:hypothetical protein
MILQDCPECDLITQRDEELKALEADAKAKGHSEDEIKELAPRSRTGSRTTTATASGT